MTLREYEEAHKEICNEARRRFMEEKNGRKPASVDAISDRINEAVKIRLFSRVRHDGVIQVGDAKIRPVVINYDEPVSSEVFGGNGGCETCEQ